MLFHSYTFAAFFLLVLALHKLAPLPLRRWVLLLASYTFLGWWNARYTLLLLVATTIDYLAAKAIAASASARARRAYLAVSMSMNIGMLALFKYYNFFAGSLSEYLHLRLPLHHLLLPIGISFYTFESMSYTIDVYRGKVKLARDFIDFALFVSFFPRLIAGPIMRAAFFLPQLEVHRARTPQDVREGMKRFFFGLFKKLVVADNLATFVDAVHRAPQLASPGDLWVSAYAFAFQIYCDFSGYSDMATGAARILGYELMVNFHRPYCARNPSEFWRRWHISLSSWLRDYLYISIGGNRQGELRTYRNLMITMVLGGLWHGANWTFVAWGFMHGALLIAHRLWQRALARLPRLEALLRSGWGLPSGVLLTFHAWVFSMVFFRASTLHVALDMLGRMARGVGGVRAEGIPILALCGVFYAAQISQEIYDLVENFDRLPLVVRTGIMVVGCWALILFTPKEVVPFLYFQF